MWFFSSKKTVQYKLQDLIFQSKSVIQYSLYDGVRISDQKQFSIFEIKVDPTSPLQQSLSKNALKIWKTFRHPAIPVFHESYESDGNIYVVTDKLLPFNFNESSFNSSNSENSNCNSESQEKILTDNEILWALHILTDFVCFLGDKANAIHGNIQGDSLFITYGHELKIAGLHWMTVNGNGPINEYYNDYENLVLDVNHYQESKLNEIYIDPKATLEEISITKNRDKTMNFYSTIDTKFIGAFISKYRSQLPERILNYGDFWSSSYFLSFSSYYATSGNVPPTPKMLLDDDFCWNQFSQSNQNETNNGNNEFIHTLLFLRDLPLKEAEDRENFFQNLNRTIKIFSIQTQEYTILPILISSLSYTKSPEETPLILEVIFLIGSNPSISEKSFENFIVPSMIPLFESKDRNIRIHLLKNIDSLIKHFSSKLINEKIFPNVILGLNDTVTAMKSATIVSMVSIATKLNKDNRKTLIRELKRLQANDQDASIRCNSVICIAKIADTIDDEIRLQTLLSTFSAASKDSFAQTRRAAISGFKLCKKFFISSTEIISNSILTTLSPLCNDASIENRILAINTMKDYLDYLLIENNSIEKDQISSSNSQINDDSQQNAIHDDSDQNQILSSSPSSQKFAFPPPPMISTMVFDNPANERNDSYSNQNIQYQSNETNSSSFSVIAHYPSEEQNYYQSYASNMNNNEQTAKKTKFSKTPLDYDEDEYWRIIKAQPPKPAKSEEVRDALMLFSNPPTNTK